MRARTLSDSRGHGNNHECFCPTSRPGTVKPVTKGTEKSGQREPLNLPSVLPKSQELCSDAHSPWEQEQEPGVARSESILGRATVQDPRRHEKALREVICNGRKTLGNPT